MNKGLIRFKLEYEGAPIVDVKTRKMSDVQGALDQVKWKLK